MENMKITGAVLKGGLFCHYKFVQEIGPDQFNSGTIKSTRPIHDDLRHAFAALAIHLPLIMEELRPEDVPDINADITGQQFTPEVLELIGRFSIHGIDVDHEAGNVTIYGAKSLSLTRVALTLEEIAYEGAYKFAMELRIVVDRLIDEVEQYVDGKAAPIFVQTEMFNSKDEEEDEEVDGKKKRKPRRKKTDPLLGNGEKEPPLIEDAHVATDDDWNSPVFDPTVAKTNGFAE